MDIPSDLLSVLKCCICEGYLSCGPIYIVENGNATCGSCNNKSNTLSETAENKVLGTRNIQYENLASIFIFPCRFALFGCSEKLPFTEKPPYLHEQSCKYKPHACEILLKKQCNWRGPIHQLLEHCEEVHPNDILENPCTAVPDFAVESVETYLIPCFNTLFALRVTNSLISERVFYSLYLLDDPCKIDMYSFSVDCKRNNLSVNKSGSIGTVENFIQQKPMYCIFNRHFLMIKLGGLAGTAFVINIEQESSIIKCKFCPAKVEAIKAHDWICTDCESILYYCKNKCINCTFKDVNEQKVKKHERYFCKHINKCFDCSGPIICGKIFQHYDSEAHANSIVSKVGVVWKATETIKRTLNYVFLKSKMTDILFCKYYLDARQFSLILCSTHSSDQLSLLKCTIKIDNKEIKFSKTYFPDLVLDFDWDWRIDIDFNTDEYALKDLDIIIDFEKTINI